MNFSSAAWVDRMGKGWMDKLGELAGGEAGGPNVVVSGVDEAVETIKKWATDHASQSGAGYNTEDAAMGPG
jgi:hypothetical protein